MSGLTITYLNKKAPAPRVLIADRLWETRDGKRLVPDGHPDAALLFCAPGHEVAQADFEAFELDESIAKPTVLKAEGETDDEPEIKSLGKGMWQLPNGEEVKGKKAAAARLAELIEAGEIEDGAKPDAAPEGTSKSEETAE